MRSAGHGKELIFYFCYDGGGKGSQSVVSFGLSFMGFLQPGKII